jgi:hypothetical protein
MRLEIGFLIKSNILGSMTACSALVAAIAVLIEVLGGARGFYEMGVAANAAS